MPDIEKLEKEVKRLKIKHETLIAYLNSSQSFGPPYGREAYDAMVNSALVRADLQE
jgi:hypothetical protein